MDDAMEKISKQYPNAIVPQHGRGFFGIGIYGLKTTKNIGTLWRSAQVLRADFIFLIGKRNETMKTDTMKSWKHTPLFEYESFEAFYASRPKGSRLIGIELDERSVPLTTYRHPERALYLLGAEDKGLPREVLSLCDEVIQIPGEMSLNVSVAGSIVLYDRLLKAGCL